MKLVISVFFSLKSERIIYCIVIFQFVPSLPTSQRPSAVWNWIEKQVAGDLLHTDFISGLMGPKTMSVSDQKVESIQVKSDLTAFSSVLSLTSTVSPL